MKSGVQALQEKEQQLLQLLEPTSMYSRLPKM